MSSCKFAHYLQGVNELTECQMSATVEKIDNENSDGEAAGKKDDDNVINDSKDGDGEASGGKEDDINIMEDDVDIQKQKDVS